MFPLAGAVGIPASGWVQSVVVLCLAATEHFPLKTRVRARLHFDTKANLRNTRNGQTDFGKEHQIIARIRETCGRRWHPYLGRSTMAARTYEG